MSGNLTSAVCDSLKSPARQEEGEAFGEEGQSGERIVAGREGE